MTFNSHKRENSISNRWKFQGQEHIEDLGLNWVSFKWRNHDPAIGRFFNVDPLASDYVYNSPYAFSENKVTAHIALEGLEAVPINPNSNPLYYMAANFTELFQETGRTIDNAGGQLKAFFSVGSERGGSNGSVNGNISNETRTTFTVRKMLKISLPRQVITSHLLLLPSYLILRLPMKRR